MDQHFLRRKWLPSDEAELRRAFFDGTLDERNWCELKKELGSSKGANPELARDLASFAVDGGTLVIGVDEDMPAGEPLNPVPLLGLPERIEQVASTRIQPPLQIECSVLPAADEDGSGYVLVNVPASPLAPHQVEGIYYGRGDKTKRRLSDPEVERLFQRRASWNVGVLDELQRLRGTRVSTETVTPQLYAVARPVAAWPEMCRPLVALPGWEMRLIELKRVVAADPVMVDALCRVYGTSADTWLSSLHYTERTSAGARLTAREPTTPASTKPDWWQLDLDIDETGTLWLFAGKVGEPDRSFNGITYAGLYVDAVASITRELLIWARTISDAVGHVAGWDFAVTVSNLQGTRAISNAMTHHRAITLGSLGNAYEAADFTGTARASSAELEQNPAVVADRLVGLLARGLRAEDYLAPLLAPTPSGHR